MQAADMDLLLRIFVILASSANTNAEQSQFARKGHSYAVAMLDASLRAIEEAPNAGVVVFLHGSRSHPDSGLMQKSNVISIR